MNNRVLTNDDGSVADTKTGAIIRTIALIERGASPGLRRPRPYRLTFTDGTRSPKPLVPIQTWDKVIDPS